MTNSENTPRRAPDRRTRMESLGQSVFASFVWKKNKFFLALNCVIVISFVLLSQWWIYAKNYSRYGGSDSGDGFLEYEEYFILLWLLFFFAQTMYVRFRVRGRAAPEKPRANLRWFLLLIITSSLPLPLGSIIIKNLLMLLFSLLFIRMTPSFLVTITIHSLFLTILPMLYLHFYILMWGGEGQEEDGKENRIA